MLWDDLKGHELQKQWFANALSTGRLATSFLFVGPEGIGKRAFAKLLAKSLLCRGTAPNDLDCCGQCEDCAQVDAGTHPDLIQVSKPPEKAFLPIELLIGEREKRMREGLCHDISLRPYGGRRKIAILDDADSLNVEGANCLLKTLEEPPTNSLMLLIGTSLQRQLPTIRSRCQSILFQALSETDLVDLLERSEAEELQKNAVELARQCQGSLAQALQLADPDLKEFRSSLLQFLSRPEIPMSELAKHCGGIVDAVGKEARLKRDRMKLVFEMSADFYRRQALDESLSGGLRRGATQCWNRCLDAIEQVDRNANQTGLLEAWSADMARLSGR